MYMYTYSTVHTVYTCTVHVFVYRTNQVLGEGEMVGLGMSQMGRLTSSLILAMNGSEESTCSPS